METPVKEAPVAHVNRLWDIWMDGHPSTEEDCSETAEDNAPQCPTVMNVMTFKIFSVFVGRSCEDNADPGSKSEQEGQMHSYFFAAAQTLHVTCYGGIYT